MPVLRLFVPISELRAVTSLAYRMTSSLSSSPATLHSSKVDSFEEINTCYNRLDLDFKSTKNAFKGKSTREIARGLIVLPMCTLQVFLKNNDTVLSFCRRLLGEKHFKKALKATFFGHFVGGETLEEVKETVVRLQKCGVKAILDYSVEADISESEAQTKAVEGTFGGELKTEAVGNLVDKQTVEITRNRYTVHKEFGDRRKNVISARTYFYENEAQCDHNCNIFCESADAIAETGGEGFIAVKLTALGRPQILLRLSEIIAQSQNFYKALTGSTWENMVYSKIKKENFAQKIKDLGVKIDDAMLNNWSQSVDFDDCGFVDYYDWGKMIEEHKKLDQMFQVYNQKTKKMEPLLNTLSLSESQEMENMLDRMVKVIEHACQLNVRTMIDAEQTYFQPAISRLTLAMMRKYNKERGMVFNTYQSYLKSCLRDVELDMHIARRENFHFGCKVVRGAYMDQERKRAAALGYEDPINRSVEETAKMYRQVLDRILKERMERGQGKVSVMVATHNEETVKLAVEMMKEQNITPAERTVCFAQLYGMCDHVSYSLGQAGYSVYKYVPYGPLKDVLPYLSRRARENGSILAKAKRECGLLSRELLRRIVTLNGRLSQ